MFFWIRLIGYTIGRAYCNIYEIYDVWFIALNNNHTTGIIYDNKKELLPNILSWHVRFDNSKHILDRT